MLRTSLLAPMIFGFTTVAVCAEDARQLTCDGTMMQRQRMIEVGVASNNIPRLGVVENDPRSSWPQLPRGPPTPVAEVGGYGRRADLQPIVPERSTCDSFSVLM
jgi:hypothetical protein